MTHALNHRLLPCDRLIGICARCQTQYSELTLCGSCLREVQSDVAEKRGVLLADRGTADMLSALA